MSHPRRGPLAVLASPVFPVSVFLVPVFVVAVLLLSVLLLLVSCGSDDPAQPSTSDYDWGEEATIWNDVLTEQLTTRGGRAWRLFWDPEITFDVRPMVPGSAVQQGQTAFNHMTAILPAGTAASAPEGSMFLSTDRMIFFNLLDWEPSGFDQSPITRIPAHLANILGPIGERGARHMVSAMSSDSWRERMPEPDLADDADDLAARWVAAFSDDRDIGPLYAPDATLVDSIGSVAARGPEEIGADIDPGAGWRIGTVEEVPAVYPLSFESRDLEGVILVAESIDPGQCPSQLAVALTVADGLITSEEHFWDVEQARRCLPADRLPDGWWVGRDLTFEEAPTPTEDLETPTDAVAVGDDAIELRNSTDPLCRLVEWSLDRFELAGLEPPVPNSITFTSYSDVCTDVRARAVLEDTDWNIILCCGEADLCVDEECSEMRPGPKHALLHELAHVWLAQNLTDPTRDRFGDHVGLDVWSDRDLAWSEQAREHAAETLAWGLIDVPLVMINIGSPSTEQLSEGFDLLTGRPPLQP